MLFSLFTEKTDKCKLIFSINKYKLSFSVKMDHPLGGDANDYTGRSEASTEQSTRQSTRRSKRQLPEEEKEPELTIRDYLKKHPKIGDYGKSSPPPAEGTPALDKLQSMPDAPTTVPWVPRPDNHHVYNVTLTDDHPAIATTLKVKCTYSGYCIFPGQIAPRQFGKYGPALDGPGCIHHIGRRMHQHPVHRKCCSVL